MKKMEFLAMVKNHMRTHKNEWLNGTFEVDGHTIGIKLYGKSIQNMTIDGFSTGGMWDIPTQKKVLEVISEKIGG